MQIEVNCFTPQQLRLAAKARENCFGLRKKGTLDFPKRENAVFEWDFQNAGDGLSWSPVSCGSGLGNPGLTLGFGRLALPPQESLDVPDQVLGVKNGAGGHALVVLAFQLGDV